MFGKVVRYHKSSSDQKELVNGNGRSLPPHSVGRDRFPSQISSYNTDLQIPSFFFMVINHEIASFEHIVLKS
jgi:hypothetical protein